MLPPSTRLVQALRELRAGALFCREFAGIPADLVTRALRYGAPLGCRIEVHDRLPRCMERLKELIAAGTEGQGPVPSGTVVIAGELGRGCGRFDRQWYAPPGGLWLALAWADTLLPEYARLLPLAAGTACCATVRRFGVPAAVKWVNDLHVGGRKLGGILCETFAGGPARDRYHLVGIGINGNNRLFPGPLRSSALSMQEALGAPVVLEELILTLLAALTYHFGLVHLQEELDLAAGRDPAGPPAASLVTDAWRQVSDTLGRRVIYGFDVMRTPMYSAVAEDIDPWGGLVLRLAEGERVTEYSGEILYPTGGAD